MARSVLVPVEARKHDVKCIEDSASASRESSADLSISQTQLIPVGRLRISELQRANTW